MNKIVLATVLFAGICAAQVDAANTQPETKAVQQTEYKCNEYGKQLHSTCNEILI